MPSSRVLQRPASPPRPLGAAKIRNVPVARRPTCTQGLHVLRRLQTLIIHAAGRLLTAPLGRVVDLDFRVQVCRWPRWRARSGHWLGPGPHGDWHAEAGTPDQGEGPVNYCPLCPSRRRRQPVLPPSPRSLRRRASGACLCPVGLDYSIWRGWWNLPG